jgi:hypothetical protein
VAHRLLNRGPPTTEPWPTGIFLFLIKIKKLSRIFTP